MNTVRYIYYKLPVKYRYLARRLFYFPTDFLSKKKDLSPPKGLIYTGSGDFKKTGEEFFSYFKNYGNITPESYVLDIGSGIGRMAIPFTTFLNSKGSYNGFDIVKQGVDWCTKNISSNHPNFHFTHVSLKNDLYNLSAKNKASNFIFPYEHNTFDFVFLTSVFTHMLPKDVNHYLNEIKRVLKTNGKCLITFFILDDESRKLMGNSSKNFKFQRDNYALMSENVKEANVAYDKLYIFNSIREKGFIIENFFNGTWSGKTENVLSYQDILILKNI